jgi:thiosulfate/3-mercaptopyruvate sulfurtransferase
MLPRACLTILLLALAGCSPPPRKTCMSDPAGCPRSAYTVDSATLARSLNRGGIHVLDLRSDADYAAGHIPGATHLDPESLRAAFAAVEGQVASAEQVASALASAGVRDGDNLVLHDADNGAGPARVAWTLLYYGWPTNHVRVLDGGWAAWTAADGAVTDAVPPIPRRSISLVAPTNARRVDAGWVNNHLSDKSVVLLDARTADEYAAGHIPGAIHLPWESTRSGTTFLDDAAMIALYGEALHAPTVVTYCDTGLRASVLWLTLKMLAHPNVRVYDGSWAEWSARDDLPKTVGATP